MEEGKCFLEKDDIVIDKSNASRSISVSGFPLKTTAIELVIHFQKRKHGGGDIECIHITDNGVAVIVFYESAVANSVLKTKQRFSDVSLIVKPLNDMSEAANTQEIFQPVTPWVDDGVVKEHSRPTRRREPQLHKKDKVKNVDTGRGRGMTNATRSNSPPRLARNLRKQVKDDLVGEKVKDDLNTALAVSINENKESLKNESTPLHGMHSKLECTMCMNLSKDPIYPMQCGHYFCKCCWKKFVETTKNCPKCKQENLVQPTGFMTWRTESHNSLPGYEEFGTILLTYNFEKGIQGSEHPNPGQSYCGLFCTSYLPNNPAGRELCDLLRKAFDARLLFTIGKSPLTSEENKIVSNGIELKTSRIGGPANCGYPDPSYLDRATSQLAEKGITQLHVVETVLKHSHRLEESSSKLQRLVADDPPKITERVTENLKEARSAKMLARHDLQQELQKEENAVGEHMLLLQEERQQKTTLEARLRSLELQIQEETNRHLSTERERTRVEEELSQARSAYKDLEERMQNEVAQIRRTLNDAIRLRDTKERKLREKETLVDQLQETLGEEQQERTRLEERLHGEMLSGQSRQQELQTKENAIREQQRLLEEERQQKTTLEARLRNLEHQMQQERNRHLSTERELQSAVSAAQEELTEYQRRQPRDWIIQRDEVLLSDTVLGKGAWGNVREGTFRSCQVAVKEIHELILSRHNRRLFEREMSIASCCRHPNLLQFIGATNDDGSPLFVTELLDTSLRHMLSQRELNHNEVVNLALDVAKGLNYLHLNKPLPIIHRDISSANVLLWRRDECWRAKLSDYGAANFMRQCMTVNPGAIIYSAPEALTSHQSPKVDVYSFGLLLCEMCVGELPVPQEVGNQIGQVTNGALRRLIERCVKKDPEERPTMSDVICELEELAKTESV